MGDTAERLGPFVLYVDDDRNNLIVFEQSLSEFDVIATDDAPTALEVLATKDVAVLVTDMRMPGMSGEELLRIVKERHPQVIRMVVTAYSDVDPILRAINEGLVARYIIKPWERAELVQILRWAIEAWTFSRDSAALHHRLLETERLVTLGSMAGMLVHDLKQPLMSLFANIETLRDLVAYTPVMRAALESVEAPRRTRELVEDLDATTNDLRTAATVLNQLLDSLRDLGRPRSVTPPSKLMTDPLPIVRHAISMNQMLAISARAQIDYRGPATLPCVRMSSVELLQVLINLVRNAAQAVSARGIPNGRVSIVAREDAAMLELEIRDDGVGMPDDVLKRVGTPFYTTRSEGTGLGLAQCQRLVGTAGGRLRIVSKVGEGTTVTITLPLAA
jgi:two-component system, response regulator PhcR